jgi:hypothetical protein
MLLVWLIASGVLFHPPQRANPDCFTAQGSRPTPWSFHCRLTPDGAATFVSRYTATDGTPSSQTYTGRYTQVPDTLTLNLTGKGHFFYKRATPNTLVVSPRPHRETLVIYQQTGIWYLLEGSPYTNYDLPLTPCN